jgi:uncharacterized protein YdhG (YjbR/CyaY superfamily)
LSKNASLEERIAWHLEHEKRCGCRPIPPALRKQMERSSHKTRDARIDDYVATLPPQNRSLLQKLRKTIHDIVPNVEECISYRLPAFRVGGEVIAGFSARSRGCSYYPFSGTTLRTLAEDLKGYSQTKSALHFEKPLPSSLVRKLLKARTAEIRARRS